MLLKNNNSKFNEKHPFHLVLPSPWPFSISMILLALLAKVVLYLHYPSYSGWLIYQIEALAFCLLFFMSRWFLDIITESTFQGHHTIKVTKGLRMGMVLFIVSEIMFFFSFFWAFFHFSLSPSIWIGAVWPPKGLPVLNPWLLPLFNSVILVSSGVSVTWAHRAIISGSRKDVIDSLLITILWGFLFTYCQFLEYINAPFSINDSAYGSIFFMATGFHGIHVLIGTLFLLVCLIRHIYYQFLTEQHIGLEAAIWYWHFVDVVWLFLFFSIYIWGS